MSSTPRSIRRAAERKRVKEEHKQLRAQTNQQNAQASTGPRTAEGKAASSRNAVRHALTGTFCVLPTENKDAYLRLLSELFTEHNPQTPTEELLVSDMVRHYWLVQRVMSLQDDLIATYDLFDPQVQKQLALFMRYQTTNQRAFHKCSADLQKLQKERKLEENGFVSQRVVKVKREFKMPAAETTQTAPQTVAAAPEPVPDAA